MVYFSREQWQLLKKTQLVVWGNQPHALEDCLHEIRLLLKTLNYAEIGQLYADARNIFMIKIANMDGDIKTLAKAMPVYLQYDQACCDYLSRYFQFFKSRVYAKQVPFLFRFRGHNFITRWLFSAHLWCEFSEIGSLVYFYWYQFQLQHCAYSDIPDLWLRYQDAYHDVLDKIDQLVASSWFWEFVFYLTMSFFQKQISKDYQKTQGMLRSRLLPNRYEDIGHWLAIDGFFEQMFSWLVNASDLAELLVNWEVYSPDSLVMYRLLTGQETSIANKGIWDNRYIAYTYQAIVLSERNGYLYQRVIEWLLKHPIQDSHTIIHSIFPRIMADYPDFIYQWRFVVQDRQLSGLINQVETLISEWELRLSRSQQCQIGIIPEAYIEVIKSFDQCVSLDTVQDYDDKISTLPYQIHTNLSFEAIRGAQIIWQSIISVLSLPKTYHDGYATHIYQLIMQHKYLSHSLAEHLQAYLCILGKHLWVKRWSKETLESLCSQLTQAPYPIISRGVKEILKAANQKQEDICSQKMSLWP